MTKIRTLKLVILGLSVWAIAVVLFTDNRGVQVVLSSSTGTSVPLERTGAPTDLDNEPTCLGGCHVNGPVREEPINFRIEIRDSTNTQVVSGYQAGQNYKINVTHIFTGRNWGFEITALQPDLTRAGTMSAADDTTLTRSADNGRQYTNHKFANSNNWTFNWTAPSPAVGTVTFWATGVRSDGSEAANALLYKTSKELPVSTPGTLQFSTSSYSRTESGVTATITVTRTGGSSGAASVQFSNPPGGTATGGVDCTAGVDYKTPSGTLNWGDGDATDRSFTVALCSDNIFEGDEMLNLALSNATGATLGSQTSATLTITNDDSQPSISISDVSQAEGNSGTTNFNFTVSLSNPSATAVTVNYATANNTATAGSDYLAIGTTLLTFNPLETSKAITVLVTGDTSFESDETFFVNLSGASGATIADSQGLGTIVNDDGQPGTLQFSTSSYSRTESGVTATITVTRTGGSAGAASVQFSSSPGGTATGGVDCTAGVDYKTPSGTLNWGHGDSSDKSFTVALCNDNVFENDETLNLALSNATVAALGGPSTATLTITNDDVQPSISITDVSQAEGNSGTTNFNFTVSLSNPSATAVTVNYATANNTATAGSDYLTIGTTLLTFNPLETSKVVTVLVTGDTSFESDETFFVNLSGASGATIADSQGQGTIVNDEGLPQPGTLQFSAATYSQTENGGTATITVTRSGGSAGAASVQFSNPAGGTATGGVDCTAGVDYKTPSGTLNWTDGDASNKSFAVTLCNDNVFEGNETMNLALSNATGATLGNPTTAMLTINEDDQVPPPFELILEESGPSLNQAAALDATTFVRDPFTVLNTSNLLISPLDLNTRVMIFVTNLQLAQGETPSAIVVNLIDSNSQSYDIPAEAVIPVSNANFTEVVFRLPSNLPPGTCNIKVIGHGRETNTATIRIRM